MRNCWLELNRPWKNFQKAMAHLLSDRMERSHSSTSFSLPPFQEIGGIVNHSSLKEDQRKNLKSRFHLVRQFSFDFAAFLLLPKVPVLSIDFTWRCWASTWQSLSSRAQWWRWGGWGRGGGSGPPASPGREERCEDKDEDGNDMMAREGVNQRHNQMKWIILPVT